MNIECPVCSYSIYFVHNTIACPSCSHSIAELACRLVMKNERRIAELEREQALHGKTILAVEARAAALESKAALLEEAVEAVHNGARAAAPFKPPRCYCGEPKAPGPCKRCGRKEHRE